MRRKTKQKFDSLQEALDAPPSKAWQTYNCTLVTPMYGGGVKAGEVDKDMPIRASSIRGQLRFWWRIACGPFASTKEMFDRETAIWGGIGDEARASQVEVRVSNVEFKGEVRAFEYKFNRNDKYVPFPDSKYGHAYVLFSAKGELEDEGKTIAKKAKKIATPELTFDLNIHFKTDRKNVLTSEQIDEAREAIRWWASFGGVGSRTRRGLGAVEVKENGEIITPVSPTEVKGGKLVLVSPKDKQGALACWKYGCDKLRDFRQGKKNRS